MERKIRRNIYILIAFTVLLLIGMVLGWFFVLVRPQREALAAVQKQIGEREQIANKMGDNLVAQKQAEDRKRYLEGQLVFFRNRYRNFNFPKLGDPTTEITTAQKYPRLILWRGLIDENYKEYGEALIGVLKHAEASVPPSAGPNPQRLALTFPDIKVDAPPKVPEEITIPASGFVRPLSASGGGTLNVSVRGTFAQIQDFLRRINLEPILFVVGAIKVDGTSPNLTASFTLTPYLIAQGEGVALGSGITTTTVSTPAPAPVPAKQ